MMIDRKRTYSFTFWWMAISTLSCFSAGGRMAEAFVLLPSTSSLVVSSVDPSSQLPPVPGSLYLVPPHSMNPLLIRGGANSASSSSGLDAVKQKASKTTSVIRKKLGPLIEKAMIGLSSITNIVIAELSDLTKVQTLLFALIFWIGFLLGKPSAGGFFSWRRFTETADMPSSLFGATASTLRGRVVSVSDGDTIRFLHVPTIFHKSKLEKGQKMSEHCLPIRLCSIDTPETAKFGKPGQAFGEEAKKFLKDMMEGKMIRIRLLQKDQYGRGVAQVFEPSSPTSIFRSLVPGVKNKGADELLLRAGLAEVYQGGGAVYGPLGKDQYLKLEQEAKDKKLGIWSKGKRESAAEFKKRNK